MIATAGLRPTRQRIAVASLLIASEHGRVTADIVYHEARARGLRGFKGDGLQHATRICARWFAQTRPRREVAQGLVLQPTGKRSAVFV